MTRQQIFSLCFFAVLLFLLYQIALMFRPFLFPVLWAVILAHLTFPLHLQLTGWLRGREAISAATLALGIMALVVVPVILLGVLLLKEAVSAEQDVRAWVASGGIERLPEQLAKLPLGTYIPDLVKKLQGKQTNVEQFLLSSVNTLSRFLVNELSDLVRNIFFLMADFLVMIFTLFFFFKDGRQWLASIYELMPLDPAHKSRILSRLDLTIRAVVKGMLLTAIAQGLLAGAAYAMLGVPFPVVLTALTILLAPLPFGGTALVWLPVSLYFLWVGPVGKALVMLAWGGGVVTMVDNILKPLLIGQGAQIPVLLLAFSVLGGLALYGVMGIFLGPILVGLFITAIQIYRDEYHQHPVATSPPIVAS
ncbi:MAG: AI-2E family transporter [Nitrospiraceae bacterium]